MFARVATDRSFRAHLAGGRARREPFGVVHDAVVDSGIEGPFVIVATGDAVLASFSVFLRVREIGYLEATHELPGQVIGLSGRGRVLVVDRPGVVHEFALDAEGAFDDLGPVDGDRYLDIRGEPVIGGTDGVLVEGGPKVPVTALVETDGGHALALDPTAGVLRRDAAGDWPAVLHGVPESIALAPDFDDSGIALAVLWRSGVWRTADFGETWTRVLPGVHDRPPTVAFFGSGGAAIAVQAATPVGGSR